MVWYHKREKYVANSLRGRGATCKVNTWMPGAADVRARWSTRTTWRIQVKSSRVGTPAWPTKKELGRLKMTATKNSETPVVALVYPNRRIKFYSARRSYCGRRYCIKPPDSVHRI